MSLEENVIELTEAVVKLTEAVENSAAPAAKTAPKKTVRNAAKPTGDKPKPRKGKKAPPPEDDDDDEITEDDIREVGTKVIKLGGAAEFREALDEFGASKTSELEEDEYAPVYEKLTAILEELEA